MGASQFHFYVTSFSLFLGMGKRLVKVPQLFVIQMVIQMHSIMVPGKPFNERTNPHYLNTELVCYSDHHCMFVVNSSDEVLFRSIETG